VRVRKPTDGQLAIGALIAFAFWIFIALPLYYGPRDDSAAYKCSAKESENYSFWEKTRCDPAAYFTIWLVGFTGVLAFSTIGLWIVTWRSGVRQSRDMEAAVLETRRIGEAQVRAYVSIKAAFIAYVAEWQHPIVGFVALNTGQSPAKNLVWNIVVQYASGSQKQTSSFNRKWMDERPGFDIPAANESILQRAMIANIPLKTFRENPGGNLVSFPRNVIVRAKIEYRYTDVFDRDWFGESYFIGIGPPPAGPEAPIGFPEKMEPLDPHPKPSDWDGPDSE
jgi:hypothetical protein